MKVDKEKLWDPSARGPVRDWLWSYGWFRRLMTPTYQCPECRHAYHYCKCH